MFCQTCLTQGRVFVLQILDSIKCAEGSIYIVFFTLFWCFYPAVISLLLLKNIAKVSPPPSDQVSPLSHYFLFLKDKCKMAKLNTPKKIKEIDLSPFQIFYRCTLFEKKVLKDISYSFFSHFEKVAIQNFWHWIFSYVTVSRENITLSAQYFIIFIL